MDKPRDDSGGAGTTDFRGWLVFNAEANSILRHRIMGARDNSYWVYVLSSKPRGTLYIGVTNGIIRRMGEHRAGMGSAFTRKYRVHRLVWLEEFGEIAEAIQREKTLKEWPRSWKINLIERANRHWTDLYSELPCIECDEP